MSKGSINTVIIHWHCPTCGLDAMAEHGTSETLADMFSMIEADHAEVKPYCSGSPRLGKIYNPNACAIGVIVREFFKSGNDVEVSRATIPRSAIEKHL